MLLGANSKPPDSGNLDTQLELRREFLPGMATKPAFTANFTNGAGPGPLRLVPDFLDLRPFAASQVHIDFTLAAM
jgi:hypothetical protein